MRNATARPRYRSSAVKLSSPMLGIGSSRRPFCTYSRREASRIFALLAHGVRAERFHKVGEAEDFHGGPSRPSGGRVLPDRQIDRFVSLEMAAVLIEIDGEAIARNDDGVLFQAPAAHFLLTRKKLQAGRIDGGEADLRLTRCRRRTHDAHGPPA